MSHRHRGFFILFLFATAQSGVGVKDFRETRPTWQLVLIPLAHF